MALDQPCNRGKSFECHSKVRNKNAKMGVWQYCPHELPAGVYTHKKTIGSSRVALPKLKTLPRLLKFGLFFWSNTPRRNVS